MTTVGSCYCLCPPGSKVYSLTGASCAASWVAFDEKLQSCRSGIQLFIRLQNGRAREIHRRLRLRNCPAAYRALCRSASATSCAVTSRMRTGPQDCRSRPASLSPRSRTNCCCRSCRRSAAGSCFVNKQSQGYLSDFGKLCLLYKHSKDCKLSNPPKKCFCFVHLALAQSSQPPREMFNDASIAKKTA